MKKRITSLAICMILLCNIFGVITVFAETDLVRTEDIFSYIVLDEHVGNYVEDHVVLLEVNDNHKTSIQIPEKIGGYPVTHIAEKAFDNTMIQNVTLPSTTTNIGVYSNDNKYSSMYSTSDILSSINIENIFVESAFYKDIDGILFSNDKKELFCYPKGKELSSYQIPNGTEIVTTSSFGENKFLKEIFLPDSVQRIDAGAFSDCVNLENVIISEGIQKIHNNAFRNCKKISKMFIPKSIEEIHTALYAFDGCESLKDIYYAGSFYDWGKITNGYTPGGKYDAYKKFSNDVTIHYEDVSVNFDGEILDFDQPPVIIDGRTLVPVRAIFEALGMEVTWNAGTYSVDAVGNGHDVHIQIGNSTANVNKKVLELDVPAQIINGRTLVPVRFVCEVLGYSVRWDNLNKIVFIAQEDEMIINMAEHIFENIGKDTKLSNEYFSQERKFIDNNKDIINELTKKFELIDSIYGAGFLIIDCINIATELTEALEKGGVKFYKELYDTSEEILEYDSTVQTLSASEYFVSMANGSYSNCKILIDDLRVLHSNRRNKKYFTHDDAVAYLMTYYLLQVDKATINATLGLLVEEAPIGILSGVSLTLKEFTLHIIPGFLSDNIRQLSEKYKDSTAINNYYSLVEYYSNCLNDIL